MRTARATTARGAVAQAVLPHFPKGRRWQLVEHEGFVDDVDVALVRIVTQSIEHSDTGFSGQHRVGVRLVITVPTDSLAGAEELLDEEVDLFLFALDAADVPWQRATKARFEDESNRLGYRIDLDPVYTSPTTDQE